MVQGAQAIADQIMHIVEERDALGGIPAKNIISAFPEQAEEAREVIWDLLTSERIELTKAKALVLFRGRGKSLPGRGRSGISPVGPGDTLYTVDGTPVAVVTNIHVRRETDPYKRWVKSNIDITVRALFDGFESGADGTVMLNNTGEILGG